MAAVLDDLLVLDLTIARAGPTAVRYLADWGATVLRIETESLSDAGKVQVMVCDNGVGIPAEQMDKVFLPFHTTKQKGLGMGLAVVQRVIERLRGSVRIESEPGRGTSVVMQIPVAR